MITKIKKLSVLLALSAASLFAVANSAHAVITGPYTPNAHTVHLWHFDDETTETVATPGGGKPADAVVGGFALDQFAGGPQLAPSILGNAAYTGFGYSGRTGPGLLSGHDGRAFYKVAGNVLDPATPALIYGSATGSFTIEGLFKWNSFDNPHQYIMGAADHFATRAGINIRDLNTPNPNLYVGVDGGGGVGGLPVSITQPVLDTWYHIALTYNAAGGANNVKVYMTEMDPSKTVAEEIASLTSSSPGIAHGLPEWDPGWGPNVEYTYLFGIGNRNGGMFDGLADEVRISNIPLGANQFMFAPDGGGEVVPEPSTYALGLIGLAGLGLFAWRRRRVA